MAGPGRLGSGKRQIAPGVHPEQAPGSGSTQVSWVPFVGPASRPHAGSDSWNLPPAAPLASDYPLRLDDSPVDESATAWARFAGAAGYLNPWGDARRGRWECARFFTAPESGQTATRSASSRHWADLGPGSVTVTTPSPTPLHTRESFVVGRRHWNPSGLGSLATHDTAMLIRVPPAARNWTSPPLNRLDA